MPEYIPPEGHRIDGHMPNTQTVSLELYRLLSIFLSSKSFAELRTGTGEEWEPIAHMEEHQEDEITRILLAVSITARVLDDRHNQCFDLAAGSCGILTDHLGEESPLSLREACNKIIHARVIHYDVLETPERQPYLEPFMYFYGERQNGAEWKAVLHVIDFAKEYLGCVRYL
jgi:hypothetical protein